MSENSKAMELKIQFAFEVDLIKSLDYAVARHEQAHIEKDLLVTLDALLTKNPKMPALLSMAQLDFDECQQRVHEEVLKKYPDLANDLPEAIAATNDDEEAVPRWIPFYQEEWVYCLEHLANSSNTRYAIDSLVFIIELLNLHDADEYRELLDEIGLTSLSMKLIDRRAHQTGGPLDPNQVDYQTFSDLEDCFVGSDWNKNDESDGAADDEEGSHNEEQSTQGLPVIRFGVMGGEDAVEKLMSQISQALGGGNVDINLNANEERASTDELPKELANMTIDLTAKARRGELDPLVGRDKELDQLFHILCGRRKNKPLILGGSGVGKTALVRGLAQRLVDGRVPSMLRGKRLLELNANVLNSRYRGVFADMFRKLVQLTKLVGNVIIFIDNVHTLLDTSADNAVEQVNSLVRLVEDDALPLILTSEFTAWRKTFDKTPALSQHLQTVDLSPLSLEDSIKVLDALVPSYETFHHVKYAPGLVEEAVKLADRYITDRVLPDSAIDVLDQLAVDTRLTHEAAMIASGSPTSTSEPSSSEEGANAPSDDQQQKDDEQELLVTTEHLYRVVAKLARLPESQIHQSPDAELVNLEERLASKVFGQDKAIGALVSHIKVSRSGLGHQERPIGTFLFTGPTGVGKTELARQLSSALHIPLLRFDMSEYSEPHTVSRLIGSPAGYVGYEDGGLLTEQVTKNPYSVVLLDEIEKAHPRLFNLMLQVMDHGRLTDASGREADFSHVILIMTSNVGARENERLSIGFGTAEQTVDVSVELKKVFSPEFRNRIDVVVPFGALDGVSLSKVVDKFLDELSTQLRAREVQANYTEALKAYLAHKGYVPSMGARPMRRLIDDELRHPMANELLFGKLAQGGTVTIDVKDGKVVFAYTAKADMKA